MRNGLFVVLMWLSMVIPAAAQVSIGINIQAYPELDRVPGYPVYYAPQMNSNYFFYDGMYWVYQDDNWYASSWYNGPWWLTSPDQVPLYVLRVPVGYYREPPAYFRGWQSNSPPHWGEHWGSGWTEQRKGWDRWNRNSAPAPAPLPAYQRQYSGDRYPGADQQQTLRSQNYRYQPREAVAREHFKAPPPQATPAAPVARPGAPPRPQSQQEAGQKNMPQQHEAIQQPKPQPQPQPHEAIQSKPQQREAIQPKPQPQPREAIEQPKPQPQQHEAIQSKPQPREAVQQPKPQPRQHEAIQQPKPEPPKAPPPQAAPMHQQQPEAKPRGPEAGPQGQGQGPAREGKGGQPPAPENDRGKPAERGQEHNQ
jgi:hypothetical protein